MPELPEVETTARGLAPLAGHRFTRVVVRNSSLRTPVPANLPNLVQGQKLFAISRRAKLLLMQLENGWLVWHLGMSGSMRLVAPGQPLRKHDHLLFHSSAGLQLRFHDPRRFGSLIHCPDPFVLPQLAQLGPEPLSNAFNQAYLLRATRNRSISIKQAIMDGKLVAGVGNIYATEALFHARIDPRLAAYRLSKAQANRLVEAIKRTLANAIQAGGTTLRDFVNSRSEPGYFQQSLYVYGRAGMACKQCGAQLKTVTLNQRSSVWCPGCQKKR